MKKMTVLFSLLVVVLFAGQSIAIADDTTKKEHKPCKVNFKPGHKLHAQTAAAPAAK